MTDLSLPASISADADTLATAFVVVSGVAVLLATPGNPVERGQAATGAMILALAVALVAIGAYRGAQRVRGGA